jgi:hypothetical protein
MKHYAGLAVSVKETSVCVVDEAGKIVRESNVSSHPEDSVDVLKDTAWRLERIGLEAGPLSQLLFSGLAEAGSQLRSQSRRHRANTKRGSESLSRECSNSSESSSRCWPLGKSSAKCLQSSTASCFWLCATITSAGV